MTPAEHEKQHRFAEIEMVLDDFIQEQKEKMIKFESEVRWWKERTKKELGLN